MILDGYHDSIAALHELALEVQELREQLATARADTLREIREKAQESLLEDDLERVWLADVLRLLTP